MAKINLLPWREERRQELQRQFFTVMGGVAIIGGLCVYVVYGFYSGEVRDQIQRNKYIESEIAGLENKITQIRELQERRDQIVDSMKVIQELQGNRPVIVHSMGEIANTIPDGVWYKKIERKGNLYTIRGIAETNNKISKLMRNIDESKWFKDPTLVKVEGVEEGEAAADASSFEMTVIQETRSQKDEEELAGGKG
jgi:type IV pilus assembly protein PilN